MEKRRSKGVTICAWFLILINAFNLLASFDVQTFFQLYKSFSKNIVVLIIAYTVFSSLVGLIAGIGLLKLKEIMRKVALAINAFDIIFTMFLFFFSLKGIREYIYSKVLTQLPVHSTPWNLDMITNIVFSLVIFWMVFCALLSMLVIFFLTRRKVKEQFAS